MICVFLMIISSMLSCNLAVRARTGSLFDSNDVRQQVGGVCYAHAIATAVRAALEFSRITGNPQQMVPKHEEIAMSIINTYGCNGNGVINVMQEQGNRLGVSSKPILAEQVPKAIKAGAAVIMAYVVSTTQHDEMKQFWQHPASKCSVYRNKRNHPATDSTTIESDKIGHAVVVRSVKRDRNKKLIVNVKNSWGTDICCDGFCKVAVDAFRGDWPDGGVKFYMVWANNLNAEHMDSVNKVLNKPYSKNKAIKISGFNGYAYFGGLDGVYRFKFDKATQKRYYENRDAKVMNPKPKLIWFDATAKPAWKFADTAESNTFYAECEATDITQCHKWCVSGYCAYTTIEAATGDDLVPLAKTLSKKLQVTGYTPHVNGVYDVQTRNGLLYYKKSDADIYIKLHFGPLWLISTDLNPRTYFASCTFTDKEDIWNADILKCKQICDGNKNCMKVAITAAKHLPVSSTQIVPTKSEIHKMSNVNMNRKQHRRRRDRILESEYKPFMLQR